MFQVEGAAEALSTHEACLSLRTSSQENQGNCTSMATTAPKTVQGEWPRSQSEEGMAELGQGLWLPGLRETSWFRVMALDQPLLFCLLLTAPLTPAPTTSHPTANNPQTPSSVSQPNREGQM